MGFFSKAKKVENAIKAVDAAKEAVDSSQKAGTALAATTPPEPVVPEEPDNKTKSAEAKIEDEPKSPLKANESSGAIEDEPESMELANSDGALEKPSDSAENESTTSPTAPIADDAMDPTLSSMSMGSSAKKGKRPKEKAKSEEKLNLAAVEPPARASPQPAVATPPRGSSKPKPQQFENPLTPLSISRQNSPLSVEEPMLRQTSNSPSRTMAEDPLRQNSNSPPRNKTVRKPIIERERPSDGAAKSILVKIGQARKTSGEKVKASQSTIAGVSVTDVAGQYIHEDIHEDEALHEEMDAMLNRTRAHDKSMNAKTAAAGAGQAESSQSPKSTLHLADLYKLAMPILDPNSFSEKQYERAIGRVTFWLTRHECSPHKWSGPQTPLRASVHSRCMEFMTACLDASADPNESDEKSVNVLHMAAYDGQTEMVRVLLDRGADPNRCDRLGQTPLFFASTHVVCQDLLNWLADLSVVSLKGQSALHMASQGRDIDVVAWLLGNMSKAILMIRDANSCTAGDYMVAFGMRNILVRKFDDVTGTGPSTGKKLKSLSKGDGISTNGLEQEPMQNEQKTASQQVLQHLQQVNVLSHARSATNVQDHGGGHVSPTSGRRAKTRVAHSKDRMTKLNQGAPR
jgi:hypothetical protein